MLSMMEDTETTFVKSQCTCGIGTFRVAFATARLPFANHLCHCDTCRHVSGEMAFYYLPIEGPPRVFVGTSMFGPTKLEPVDPRIKDLTAYQSSPNTVRYFCHVCSAHMFKCKNETEWYVSGGSLETQEDIATLCCHTNVGDTLDGGLADMIPSIDGKVLPRYTKMEGSEQVPFSWRSERLKTREESREEPTLRAYCHCKAIDIYLTRPDEQSAAPHVTFPDIMYPIPQTRLATLRNANDVKWWLRPLMYTNSAGKLVPLPSTAPSTPLQGRSPEYDGRIEERPKSVSEATCPSSRSAMDPHTRYLAGHCVCQHCRRTSGFDVQSWIFVSRNNVFQTESKKQLKLGSDAEGDRPKDLKQYSSSPGRYHEFCRICGATAFWWLSGRAHVIDVSVGLVDQSTDGVRAEEWVKWHKERLSFIEKSLTNKELVHGLRDGILKLEDPIYGQG